MDSECKEARKLVNPDGLVLACEGLMLPMGIGKSCQMITTMDILKSVVSLAQYIAIITGGKYT